MLKIKKLWWNHSLYIAIDEYKDRFESKIVVKTAKIPGRSPQKISPELPKNLCFILLIVACQKLRNDDKSLERLPEKKTVYKVNTGYVTSCLSTMPKIKQTC